MRGVLDIFNKWWNVLGKKKSFFPYTYIVDNPDVIVIWGYGDEPTKMTFELSSYYGHPFTFTSSVEEHAEMHDVLGGLEIGSTMKLTQEQGIIKYLKINNTVIFDIR